MTAEGNGAFGGDVAGVRLLELIDRFFPVVWLVLYVLLPVSGEASDSLTAGFDQRQYLDALRSVLSEGHADAIDANQVGPAYVALAALIHVVTGVSPENALIGLSRSSYALSIVAGMILVRVLVRRLAFAPPMTSLVAQVAFLALAFVARTWNWSDFPWTHFLAAFLCAFFYVLRLAPARLSVATALAVGITLALLALTRSFEFAAVVVAWPLVLGIFVISGIRGERTLRRANVVAGASAFVATAATVCIATGKRDFFLLNPAGHAGDFLPAEIGNPPTFSFEFLPVKLVQLLVDPCFYSLCSFADYSSGASPWRMPLATQLPSLVLLPFCVVAIASVLGWCIRHRETARRHALELRLTVEMTVAASGLVLGYAASTIASSNHLQYGLPRVFMLPALLAGVVAVALIVVALRLAVVRSGRLQSAAGRLRLSPDGALVFVVLLGTVTVVAAVTIARTTGLPRLESRHLGSVEYAARCDRQSCDVAIEATTVSGDRISIPRASTLTFGCGTDDPRFTLYFADVASNIEVPPSCSEPRLVSAWPTVMGLPPSPSQLRAVRVTNAEDE